MELIKLKSSCNPRPALSVTAGERGFVGLWHMCTQVCMCNDVQIKVRVEQRGCKWYLDPLGGHFTTVVFHLILITILIRWSFVHERIIRMQKKSNFILIGTRFGTLSWASVGEIWEEGRGVKDVIFIGLMVWKWWLLDLQMMWGLGAYTRARTCTHTHLHTHSHIHTPSLSPEQGVPGMVVLAIWATKLLLKPGPDASCACQNIAFSWFSTYHLEPRFLIFILFFGFLAKCPFPLLH